MPKSNSERSRVIQQNRDARIIHMASEMMKAQMKKIREEGLWDSQPNGQPPPALLPQSPPPQIQPAQKENVVDSDIAPESTAITVVRTLLNWMVPQTQIVLTPPGPNATEAELATFAKNIIANDAHRVIVLAKPVPPPIALEMTALAPPGAIDTPFYVRSASAAGPSLKIWPQELIIAQEVQRHKAMVRREVTARRAAKRAAATPPLSTADASPARETSSISTTLDQVVAGVCPPTIKVDEAGTSYNIPFDTDMHMQSAI